MAKTYTVKKGDCLWNIAAEYLGSGLKWTYLADINGISRSNPIIYVDQKIKLEDDTGGTKPPTTTKKNTTSRATISYFGLQAGTDTSVFAAWSWDKSNTDNYKVAWYYDTGNGIWFVGDDSEVSYKQSIYSAPSNAKRVKFKVKPVSKKHTVNKKEVSYWTASWSTEKIYDFKNNPPGTPSAPSVTIEDYKLTAELDNLDINATTVEFQIVKDNKTVFKKGSSKIVTAHASYSCTVTAGSQYKVRCRGVRSKSYGEWSEYSSNVNTKPAAPSKITVCRANSETSVYLEWSAVANADTYEIEYATKLEYFDGSDQTSTINSIEFTHYEKTGLESGDEYFFRVRAVNDEGSSSWTDIKSVVIGKTPEAPTTWSTTTTAITGEPLTLYWVHNSEDGSKQKYAEVEITIGGKKQTYTIRTDSNDDDGEEEETYSYPIDTSVYTEGTQILWRVRTAGITLTYGDWSIQRTIDIYAPPTLEMNVTDINGNAIDNLTAFPFYVSALAGPNTQMPIGYHLVISSNEIYETIDDLGNSKMVNKDEQVYSKYFDINEELLVELSANNVDLENNIEYTVTCSVTMNSGLTVTETSTFTVAWTDMEYEPNAEIGYDNETYSCYIRPYCEDENGDLIEGVMLSVYRREFDGQFTELIKNVDNTKNTYINDPHPALDYARYRIVAITKDTGAVSYCDMPGYPIGEPAAIIQWDEDWSLFEATEDTVLSQPPWSGSLLRIPYNIDISDSYDIDSELVSYIGREHPVAYYGTQLGHTSSWSMEIPKEDKETLYTLRRLSRWTGDVYVREPSGSGYWASISVSYNQKHNDLTIPISFEVTRVEGGV